MATSLTYKEITITGHGLLRRPLVLNTDMGFTVRQLDTIEGIASQPDFEYSNVAFTPGWLAGPYVLLWVDRDRRQHLHRISRRGSILKHVVN